MCTLVILRRPEHAWPVLIGVNREEMIDRPSQPPGRHWPDRAEVVAGIDLLAGGSWLGLNDWGVAAAVLNRQGSLGQATGMRSRGELVLEALDHADAVAAAAALTHLDPAAYRTFNLIVADNRDAFWLRHDGGSRIEVRPIAAALSLIASGDIAAGGVRSLCPLAMISIFRAEGTNFSEIRNVATPTGLHRPGQGSLRGIGARYADPAFQGRDKRVQQGEARSHRRQGRAQQPH